MTTYILGDNVPRKSKFDPDLAKKLTKYYEEHPEELEKPIAPTSSVSHTSGPLELIEGDYLTAIKAAVPETIQTSAELQKTRIQLNAQNDDSLNDLVFYTSNVLLYGAEKGKAFLLYGGREAFLHLYVPHIDEVYKNILNSQNRVYTLPDADNAWALDEGIISGSLKLFDLAELIENKVNDYGYFTIDTKNASQLNGAKRELAKLIHGPGKDYFESMQMLAGKGISKTKIFLLNPDTINSFVGNNLVGRASRLDGFRNRSNFGAAGQIVDSCISLRGVRKK